MFPYIDLHCDTLKRAECSDYKGSLMESTYTMVDFDRLKKGGAMGQFFAIFLPAPEDFHKEGIPYTDDDSYIERCVRNLKGFIEENPNMAILAEKGTCIKDSWKDGKISSFLTLEDGRSVNGSFEKLIHYHNMGIRLITMTWNYENCFGYPNSTDSSIMNQGLKPFGKEAIEAMNELGILVDVSHLSDGGFWDVAKISKKPFVASHSNCRNLTNHPRNLTDDMIHALADKGGIAGLNFCPLFLSDKVVHKGEFTSRIEDMVRHLNHMKNKGGEDYPAIGSDFDGIGGFLEIDSPLGMSRLFDALIKDGWSERQIEKLAYKNALRVLEECVF